MIRHIDSHRFLLFSLILAVSLLTCRQSDRIVVPFQRLTDERTMVVYDSGESWRIPGHQIQRTAPYPAADISRNADGKVRYNGSIEIPRGSLLLGVDIGVHGDIRTDPVHVLIHLFEHKNDTDEVEGFPLRLAVGEERQILCKHRYNPSPLYWRAECVSSRDNASERELRINIRGRFARAKSLDPGFQYLRASGETRPSLLFTPGTSIATALPEGAGWAFQSGIAQPVRGCAVSAVLRSSSGDSLLGVFKTPTSAWTDSALILPTLHSGDSLIFHCHGPETKNGVIMLGDPVVRQVTTSPYNKPNILMISLDTVRADALEPWAQQGISPGIGAFARKSAVWMNAYAPAPVTDASHRSLFCGLLSNRHTFLGKERGSSPTTIRMMAEVLSQYGYRTGGFTDGGLISSAYGFHRGFDRYWEYSGDPRNKVHLPRILSLAVRWIKNEGQRHPWLTFVHTYQAHSPYVLHEHKDAPAINISVIARMQENVPLRHQATLNSQKIPTERHVKELVRKHYRSEITYLDKHISSFLDNLSERGFLDNTIVILFSDHGEGFGEHGLLGHNNSIYEEQTRIPLIIRFPHGEHSGRVITQTVRLIDVYPTILDYLGIPADPGLDGQSLLTEIGEDGEFHRPVLAHQLWHMAVTTWPYKLIAGRNGFTTRLYNLERDPVERHDILPNVDHAVVDSLKRILIAGFIESEPGRTVTISRPRTKSVELSLIANDCREWSFLFMVKNDRIEKRPDGFTLNLVPSNAGSVSLFVPSTDGIRLETGNERVVIGDQTELTLGGIHFAITQCMGTAPGLEVDYPRSYEHTERLKALGYLQ